MNDLEEKKPKIIVAHPGKQHSFRLASALKKAGMLDSYCTTVYDKESSGLMKITRALTRGSNRQRAEGRKNPDLRDEEVVQFSEFFGLVTIAATRLDKTKNRKIYRAVNKFTSDKFGKKVAKYAIKRNVDAVICNDTGALKCWEILSKYAPHIKRIMDSSHMARPAEKLLIEKEIAESENNTLKEENIYLWNDRILTRLQREIDLTQYFLSPSGFVTWSLTQCGVNEQQCLKVPYGSNIESGRVPGEHSGKVKFVFVGGISYAKGVHRLLKVFSKLDPQQAELTLIGACNKESELYKKYCNTENISFTGWVLKDQVKQHYEAADVFVLYSPREGMAQVGIEAMTCGLPIIVSERTGVNDLVSEGKTGFVVPYGDDEVLLEKMNWFLENPSEISQMGINAQKTAQLYTWQHYEEEIAKTMTSLFNEEAGKE